MTLDDMRALLAQTLKADMHRHIPTFIDTLGDGEEVASWSAETVLLQFDAWFTFTSFDYED